jgi:hypothetical protein
MAPLSSLKVEKGLVEAQLAGSRNLLNLKSMLQKLKYIS